MRPKKNQLKSIGKSKGVWSLLRAGYGIQKIVRRKLKAIRCTQPAASKLVSIPGYRHVFCGYYDCNPFCPQDESLVLAHLTNLSLMKSPRGKSPITIGLIDWKAGRLLQKLGETCAWNWQQGARAMWLPNGRWIYNHFNPTVNRYESIIGEVGNSTRIQRKFPVQEVSKTGKLYSIDYSVLAEIRPDYGYFCKPANDARAAALIEYSEDNDKHRVVVAVAELSKETERRIQQPISKPKINHVLCNPSGSALVFMFRYFAAGKRFTDVYHVNLNDQSRHLLLDKRKTSHYCWLDDEQLLTTTSKYNSDEFGYFLVHAKTCDTQLLELRVDGHPTSYDKDLVLSDSYANQFGIRELWWGRIGKQLDIDQLGSFIEPWYLWGGRRCDLHPSLSCSRKYWQIDTVCANKRMLCIGTTDSKSRDQPLAEPGQGFTTD